MTLDLTGKTDEEVERIGYGSYLINAAGTCADCHTWQGGGFLAGGRRFALGPTQFVTSRNLTPDPTTGLPLTEDQFIEALRTGKDFHSRTPAALIVMPWNNIRWLSTANLKALYAYLRAIPPVANLIPPDDKPIVAPIPFPDNYNTGDVERELPSDDVNTNRSEWRRGLAISPLAAPGDLDHETRDFGRGSYIVNTTADCTACHTWPNLSNSATFQINTAAFLSGGRLFLPPPPVAASLHEARALSADLSGATHGFLHEADSTFDRFLAIIRTGTHADESPPRPLAFPMPWAKFRLMLDDDLRAIYTYASLLPARTAGGDKLIPNYARWCATAADCRSGETCFDNPATHLKECVGAACSVDSDCDACQTCTVGVCTAPTASNTCLTNGIP